MNYLADLRLMSQYNQWMNQKVYRAALNMDNKEIERDRGAFFGSISGTLNHIYVADIIWLTRFSCHSKQYQSLKELPVLESYTNLRASVTDDFKDLFVLRQELDNIIADWCEEIELADLEHHLKYTDTQNNPYSKNFGRLIQHFFNHQTHHRGQVSTLLFQQGIDIGVSDLLRIIPDVN